MNLPRRTLALLLAAAVILAWLPSLGGAFVWDDQHDLVLSDKLHHWRSLLDVFRHHAMWSANNQSTVATYRPLALASLALDYQLWGLHPLGFHATSIAMHAMATVALFYALTLLVEEDLIAAVLALLFALHPANAEAVAWINGRSELIALGFGALALRSACLRRWPSLALFLLGAMLGKETGALFVPLSIAFAWLVPSTPIQPRESLHPSWPPIFSSLAALAVYLGLRTLALRDTVLPSRLGAALTALPSLWFRATRNALWPRERAPVTLSTWLASTSTAERHLYLALAITALALLIFLIARRRYTLALCILWWLGSLLPASAVLVLDYPWPGLARWLYIGLPGLIVAVWLGVVVWLPPAARITIAVAVGLAWLVAAERSIRVWHDDLALYQTMSAQSPDDAWAERALGITLLNARRYDEALTVFRHVETIDRTTEVHAAFGLHALTLTYLDRCDEALTIYRAHLPTPAVLPDSFAESAAACFWRQQKIETARKLYLECAATRPTCAAAIVTLSPPRLKSR